MDKDIFIFVSEKNQYYLVEEIRGDEVLCSDSDGAEYTFQKKQIDFIESDGARFDTSELKLNSCPDCGDDTYRYCPCGA